jgi:hypothetical protein
MGKKKLKTRRGLDSKPAVNYSDDMEFNPKKCPKCKGKKRFHVGTRVSFAGDYSHFSLGSLADMAGFLGFRVCGSKSNWDVLVSTATAETSRSVRKAESDGIIVLSPDEFAGEMKKICLGSMSTKPNPIFSTLPREGGRIYYIGANKEHEAILNKFLKKHGMTRAQHRTKKVVAAVSENLFLDSGDARLFKSMDIPVYSFGRIQKTLQS